MENLKSIFNYLSKPRILDVGTGVGNFIDRITKVYDDYMDIIGIDVKLESIEVARNNFESQRIKFMQMNSENMSFNDDTFDIVCLSNSLHHLQNINKTISEMKRVLKPNGLLVFNEMFCDKQDDKQKTHVYIHHFWAEIDRIQGITHNETYKREDIIEMLIQETGFRVVDSWDVSISDLEESSNVEIEELLNSVDRALERVRDSHQFSKYERQAQNIKDRLLRVGFKEATQLMVILK